MHPNAPTLEQLHEIRKALYTEASTDENLKKIKAVEHQIAQYPCDKTEKADAKQVSEQQEPV
jgi:hypothetical protein